MLGLFRHSLDHSFPLLLLVRDAARQLRRRLDDGRDGELGHAPGDIAVGQHHFDVVGAEAKAVRASVGLMETSGFAKYTVKGPGAEAWLASRGDRLVI